MSIHLFEGRFFQCYLVFFKSFFDLLEPVKEFFVCAFECFASSSLTFSRYLLNFAAA